MNDQAQRLRDLMEKDVSFKNEISAPVRRESKVIAVSSGKGGVGKTNISLNTAIGLADLGYSVCVIDADIGLSNIEILAGVSTHRKLSDMIKYGLSIEDIITMGPGGISMISGGSGLNELRVITDESSLKKLLYEIQKLQEKYDYIIIDTGAGISQAVTDFIRIADAVIVVSTPDPTSIMDSYTLIKTISNLGFRGKCYLISNMVKNCTDGQILSEKMQSAAKTFLQLEIINLGYIQRSDVIVNSVQKQVPFIIGSRNSQATRAVRQLCNILAGEMEQKDRDDKKSSTGGLISKLLNVFKK